jgi:hypothetical protein
MRKIYAMKSEKFIVKELWYWRNMKITLSLVSYNSKGLSTPLVVRE